MVVKLAAAMLVLWATSAFGQTASDFESKYGKPTPAYSVSEHIWMSPEYAADGQVCQIRLLPKSTAPNSGVPFGYLPFEELKGVLHRLAPPRTLGTKKEPFSTTTTGGGAAWTIYRYEKVTFSFAFSFRVDASSEWKTYTYEFPASEAAPDKKASEVPPDKEPTNVAASEDDFSPSRPSKTELVTIKWNARKCTEK